MKKISSVGMKHSWKKNLQMAPSYVYHWTFFYISNFLYVCVKMRFSLQTPLWLWMLPHHMSMQLKCFFIFIQSIFSTKELFQFYLNLWGVEIRSLPIITTVKKQSAEIKRNTKSDCRLDFTSDTVNTQIDSSVLHFGTEYQIGRDGLCFGGPGTFTA